MAAIHPVCNVVSAAMAKTGLSYKDIAEKTGNLSEIQVKELCAGRILATPEEHDVICKVLGLATVLPAFDQKVFIGRSHRPEIPHPLELASLAITDDMMVRHHDAYDAGNRTASPSYRTCEESNCLASFAGDVLPDHLKITVTEQSVRAGLVGDDELKALFSDNGGFNWLKLKNIIKYTEDTSRFDFEFDDPDIIYDVLVSSTCVVTAPDDKPLYENPCNPCTPRPLCTLPGRDAEGPVNVYRAYTPITERGAVGIVSLAIKKQVAADPDAKYPGLMSNYVYNMKIGDTLGIMANLQRAPSMTPWILNKNKKVTLIAGGTGITPLLQILQYSLATKANVTKFVLLYANTYVTDIALRHELDAFHTLYPDHFKVIYIISKNIPDGWTGEKRRIDQQMIKDHAYPPGAGSLVCISGPPAFLNAIAGPRKGNKYDGFTEQGELKGYLKNLGYTAEQVHKF